MHRRGAGRLNRGGDRMTDRSARGSRRRSLEAELVVGRRPVAEAIKGGLVTEVIIAPSPTTTGGLRSVLEAAEERGVLVRTVPRATLDALAEDHRGVVARVGATRGELSERDLVTFPFGADAVVVVLDGIVDPQNLGAAARSAEAAGAEMLVTRTRRAADVTTAAVRASAGALVHLPHARVANIARAVERLHDAGFWVVGLDERAGASVYDDECPAGKVAVVIGGEGSGMSRLTRERCDLVLSLPMRGTVGSLNAAASLAAVLYAYVLPTRD
ncbi:MAG TPA: 23S rRNA (guanosine(2251)-2'-O)-methyltransferase RlmB [Actinomycetota bacterium]|nr:23S rRNA (guanosine(2251)-2'-O)-methyltransferase RlmB [Actinomycetota bacterium]